MAGARFVLSLVVAALAVGFAGINLAPLNSRLDNYPSSNARTNSGAEQSSPSTADYGWWQFASFLHSQNGSGIISPTSFPVPANYDPDWDSTPWKNKNDLNLGTPPCSLNGQPVVSRFDRSALEYPVQLRIPINGGGSDNAGKSSPSRCQGIQQIVLYNSVASQDITGESLSSIESLKALLSSGKRVSFRDHSVVIKELWEPIWPGHLRISVWQPLKGFFMNPPMHHTYGDISNWPTIQVSVTSAAYTPYQLAPISVFAHSAVTPGSTPSAYVLVGLNIAHKIQGTWYWYTFSWLDGESDKISSAGGQCMSTWHQYCMNVTNSQAGKACFNPYLEGQQPGGIYSNCARCHQFAAFPKNEMDGISLVNGLSPTPTNSGQFQQYMRGAISVDSLWSLISHLPGQNLQ
ncbi:MAG TPA: hypothetical protein VKB38_10300 [Terracidiphilus sp.]|nr:hypothetical protein [Terracidiphilus sp.]